MSNEVVHFSELMESMVFKHIYNERNIAVDELANAGTTVQEGFWHIIDHNISETTDSLMPF